MSTPTGTDSESIRHPSVAESGPSTVVGGSWMDALGALLTARVALIQHESKGAARQWIRTAVLLAVAALGVWLAWLLLVAGGVAALAAATGLAWYWLAIAAAALHLIAAAICLTLAKSAAPPAFPLTRNEFLKDREWLQSLTNRRK